VFIDKSGVIKFVNKMWESRQALVVGDNLIQHYLTNNSNSEFIELKNNLVAIAQGHGNSFETDILDKDLNRWFHYAMTKMNFSDEGVLITIDDITARKSIELAYEQSEKDFRVLAENAPEIILKLNNDLFVEYINVGSSKLFNKNKSSYHYKDFDSENYDNLLAVIQKVRSTKIPNSFTSVRKRDLIRPMYFQTKIGPIIDDNQITGFICILQDITVLKNAQESLEEKVEERTRDLERAKEELSMALKKEKEIGELKSRFVATASHQFRTPLTTIQATLGLLSMHKEKMGDEFVTIFDKSHQRIIKEISNMTELMNEVLILGKINSGSLQVNIELISVAELTEAVIEGFNVLEPNRIEFNVYGTEHEMKIDKKLFEHALSNFVSNALKYSPKDKIVSIELTFSDNTVVLAIKDSGIGIPAKDLKYFFDPFFRASNVMDIKGTGLGTSIAKDYIEMQGGKVEVSSELGQGTEIKLICE
jgi:signal transduction histidine kinase